MKLPMRDDWLRVGYTIIGGGSAILWNRYLPLDVKGGGYIPPAALALILIMSENSGDTEKDIASLILGYTTAAQTISFAKQFEAPKEVGVIETMPSVSVEEINANPLDNQMDKLNKIRNITGTLGAITELVNTFKGNK